MYFGRIFDKKGLISDSPIQKIISGSVIRTASGQKRFDFGPEICVRMEIGLNRTIVSDILRTNSIQVRMNFSETHPKFIRNFKQGRKR